MSDATGYKGGKGSITYGVDPRDDTYDDILTVQQSATSVGSRPDNPTSVTYTEVINNGQNPITIGPFKRATMRVTSSTLYDCTTWSDGYYKNVQTSYVGVKLGGTPQPITTTKTFLVKK